MPGAACQQQDQHTCVVHVSCRSPAAASSPCLTCCWFLTSATAFCARQSIWGGRLSASRLPWLKLLSLLLLRTNLRKPRAYFCLYSSCVRSARAFSPSCREQRARRSQSQFGSSHQHRTAKAPPLCDLLSTYPVGCLLGIVLLNVAQVVLPSSEALLGLLWHGQTAVGWWSWDPCSCWRGSQCDHTFASLE